jgi:hypothetical protein
MLKSTDRARGAQLRSFRVDKRAVLTYARDLSLLDIDILGAAVTELKDQFDDRAIVELTAAIGFYNCACSSDSISNLAFRDCHESGPRPVERTRANSRRRSHL